VKIGQGWQRKEAGRRAGAMLCSYFNYSSN
jgi:hypothetical protein